MNLWAYNTDVVVPAASHDLTVLSTLKQELDIANAESDELLARMISEQSASITEFCSRFFAKETLKDTFKTTQRVNFFESRQRDTDLARPLLLSRTPVSAILEVIEVGNTLSAGDYELVRESGMLRRCDEAGHWINWLHGKIEVTFVGGYSLLAELPRAVERAVIVMCKSAFYARKRDPSLRAESIEGIGSQQFWVDRAPTADSMTEFMPAEAISLLNNYRNIRAL